VKIDIKQNFFLEVNHWSVLALPVKNQLAQFSAQFQRRLAGIDTTTTTATPTLKKKETFQPLSLFAQCSLAA
jgi:hypothetical protein